MLATRRFAVLLAAPVVFMLCGCPGPDCNFVVSIEREFQTEEEGALITIAENVCPPREDVLVLARPEDRDALEAAAGDGCLWYYTCGGVPFAITAEAIDYWAGQVSFREAAVSPYWPLYPNARFEYFATIQFHEEFVQGESQFENVYVVTMSMGYGESVAPLAGWGFSKERTVVLTAEGEVLAVFGDGETFPWVS